MISLAACVSAAKLVSRPGRSLSTAARSKPRCSPGGSRPNGGNGKGEGEAPKFFSGLGFDRQQATLQEPDELTGSKNISDNGSGVGDFLIERLPDHFAVSLQRLHNAMIVLRNIAREKRIPL